MSTNPRELLTLLRNAKGQPAESLVRDHVQTMMSHRADLQKAQQVVQHAKDPQVSPAAKALATQHAQGVMGKFSELQKLATLLQKHAGAPRGFAARGLNQLSGLAHNPGGMLEAAKGVYGKAGGGFAGAGAVAGKYAPGLAMAAAPVAAGAALGYMAAPNAQQQQQPGQVRTASIKTGAERIAELSKAAWSITDEGHKLDAAHYNADSEAAHKKVKAHGEYTESRPGLSQAGTIGDIMQLLSGAGIGVGGKGSHAHNAMNQFDSRHMDYAAKKHEGGENAYNPFGGMFTPSRHEEKDEKKSKKDDKKTEKKSSFGPAMHSLREKIALLPLAAAAPAVAGAAKGLMGGAVARYAASKAVPMAMNAGMNMLGAGPGAGNKLKAGLAGAATGLIPGSGVASQVAGMAAQPLANKAFGVG